MPHLTITASAGVEVRRRPTRETVSRLNREATQAKYSDWPRALACLREVKALEGDHYDETRLAKFLQEAGHFDDALVEIQWLLDRIGLHVEHLKGSERARMRATMAAEIRHAAVDICALAGRRDLAAVHLRIERRLLWIVKKLEALS